jgi:acyl-homoserine-lactone acylase
MRRSLVTLAALALVAAACTSDEGATADPVTTVPASSTTVVASTTTAAPPITYTATIRRTSHNVPHIVADDLASLGFGQGYALAEDHACTLGERVIRAKGELSRYYGPGEGDAFLNSDLALRHLQIVENAEADLASLSADVAGFVAGYAAGYNRFLADTGPANVPGWCAGAEWLVPVDSLDLMAVYKQLALLASGDNLLEFIATARPPGQAAGDAMVEAGGWEVLADAPVLDLGSNGWGLGKEVTENGRGIMFINPHFPWEGALRLWESHLTIPGELNVYGGSLIGTPGVLIGFNEAMAWMHPVSPGKRFTAYLLQLSEGDPTRYIYEGGEREMIPNDVTVDVLQPDGSLAQVTRTLYSSLHGPVLSFPGVGWSDSQVVAYRDANIDNRTLIPQFVAINRAGSLSQYQEAQRQFQGIPWVHTVSVSSGGEAWYIDSTPTPNLSADALAAYEASLSNFLIKLAADNGVVLLDGTDPLFEWVEEPGARSPGLVPFERMPQIQRDDWVFNSNDSYWLSNPAAPITGVSPLHGLTDAAQSARTRQNLVALTDASPQGPRGEDGLWSFEEVKDAVLDNRSFTAALLVDELLAACRASGEVDLTKACDVLEDWDRTFNLDSRGAVLFREWINRYRPQDMGQTGQLLATPFDSSDPIGTPAKLANPDTALTNLASAVTVLETAGLPLDVPLGELQFADRNGVRVPIHGGTEIEGITNKTNWAAQNTTTEPLTYERAGTVGNSRDLTTDGYPIGFGGSFIMVVEFTDDGPRASAFLTYGETGDPNSEFFSDQTIRYSNKNWRDVAFSEADIAADLVREYQVSG